MKKTRKEHDVRDPLARRVFIQKDKRGWYNCWMRPDGREIAGRGRWKQFMQAYRLSSRGRV